MAAGQIGETMICRWKGGAAGAFSVGGDDSLRSQLFFAIPEMDKRGIHGTWWINPGRGGSVNYKNQDDAWAECWIACYDGWKAAAACGHDFGNHSMLHLGAKNLQEAEWEIGESARTIWRTNPRQRLQLFLSGGGTTWSISQAEMDETLERYHCVQGRGGGIECPTWETNPSAETFREAVDTAIREGTWHFTAFHGIGPDCEWGGPIEGGAFTALLDYLVEKRGQVWTGTFTEVHKYNQERSTARLGLVEASSNQIRLELTSAKDPILYDFPLTLRTVVPGDWRLALVTQGSRSSQYPVEDGSVMYEAMPGREGINLLLAS